MEVLEERKSRQKMNKGSGCEKASSALDHASLGSVIT